MLSSAGPSRGRARGWADGSVRYPRCGQPPGRGAQDKEHRVGKGSGSLAERPGRASLTAPPRPVSPRGSAHSMYRLHHLLEANDSYRRRAAWLEAGPRLSRLFTAAEAGVKKEIFGCRMCGQCAIPVTGYACPMTCPKQLRNGPCGGVGADGSCEVYPALRCVWLVAFERAENEGRSSDLLRLQRPIDS